MTKSAIAMQREDPPMPLRQRRRRLKSGMAVPGKPSKSRPDRRARGGACEEERKDGGNLTAKERNALPKSDFALPGKGTGKEGKGSGSYPIPDENHARNALARVAQHGTSAEKAEVRRKVHAKYPGIKESGK